GEQAAGPAYRRPGALGRTGVHGGTHVSTVGTPSLPRPSSGRGRRRAGLDTGALPGGSDNLAHVTESQARRFERGTDGPKVIVVGVDGSESSMRAAAYALGLARRQGATLAAVYVRPGMAAGVALGAPAADATDEIADELVTQIREAAQRVRDLSAPRWQFHTFRGDPYNGLVKAADDLRADAVVVGASEKAGHRFVGSVAVRLVKTGRWPVTVVP